MRSGSGCKFIQKSKNHAFILFVIAAVSGCKGVPSDQNSSEHSQQPKLYRVNEQGQITENGEVFPVRCGNWTGLEGQALPEDAMTSMEKAPMELFIGNMWWVDSGRSIEQTMREISALGINMIRLPIAPQTLEPGHPDGMIPEWDGEGKIAEGMLKNTAEEYPYIDAREALLGVIDIADQYNVKVLVGIHSCSNFVGKQAGKLDSAPPYLYINNPRYSPSFVFDEYSCLSSGNGDTLPYNEEKWLNNLRDIAEIANSRDNVIGVDIFSEPWEYTWDEWAALAEKAYQAIAATNENILVFVEGVGFQLKNGEPVAHGETLTQPSWGENLWGFKERPLNIPRERVVYSPHVYGPSLYVKPQYLSGECQNYQGDEAAEEGCHISLDQSVLSAGWEEHFGFLRDMNYAVLVSEFGGNMDWPRRGTDYKDRETWAHIDGAPDEQWQNMFVDYMKQESIDGCYWSINPDAGFMDGIYETEYDLYENDEAWGKWGDFDARVVELLGRFWGE